MASLNKVQIIGRLGKDPELKYTQSGQAVTNFSVATDESYTSRDGARVEGVEWHRVNVWDRMAENCANYLRKGSLVYVEGSLKTRQWQDQQGQTRYSTEIRAQRIQFLDTRGQGQAQGAPTGAPNDEEFGAPEPQRAAPRQSYAQPAQQQAPRQPSGYRQPAPQSQDEDLGPAFPSEASGMDEVPF
jgi:single-strand DNA-binding protein